MNRTPNLRSIIFISQTLIPRKVSDNNILLGIGKSNLAMVTVKKFGEVHVPLDIDNLDPKIKNGVKNPSPGPDLESPLSY